MKHKNWLLGLLIAGSSVVAYANECSTDVDQMRAQVQQYGSITTPGGLNRFTGVDGERYDNKGHCYANGYYGTAYFCKISWSNGDWGATFHCE